MLNILPLRPVVNPQLPKVAARVETNASSFEARFDARVDCFREELEEVCRRAAARKFESAFEAHIEDLLGRSSGQWRDRKDDTLVSERCSKCGAHRRCQFYRKGHRPRNLVTTLGVLELQVPRLECICGGQVSVTFPQFAPRVRRYKDVNEEMLLLSGMCLSLRQVRAVFEARKRKLSLSTIAGVVAAVADVTGERFSEEGQDAPPVVMLDGIWANAAEETGESFTDTRGRKRKRKRIRKKPLLVAWGIYPESGKQVLLGWVVGKEEDATSWGKLLRELDEQGVCYRNGLRLFIHDGSGGLMKAFEQRTFGPVAHQRCIFHKMRNVVDAVVGMPEMSKKEKRERRKEVLADLVEIWEAPTEEEAQRRLEQLAVKWEDKETKAVETLRNDFAETLAYYAVQMAARAAGQTWERRYLRTTSPLERANRTIRTKLRAAVIFQSEHGMKGNVYLTIGCRAKTAEGDLGHWIRELAARPRGASVRP